MKKKYTKLFQTFTNRSMSLSSPHLNKDGQKNNGKSCPNEKWGGRDDAHAEVEKVKK